MAIQRRLASVGRWALIASATGCSAKTDNTVESDLDDARASWADAGLSEYQLIVTSGPNQLSSDGCEWATVVANAEVTSATVMPSSEFGCEVMEWSVERLHDLVADLQAEVRRFDAPEFGEYILDVDYGGVGVPIAIEFDLARGDDEELSYQVELTPRT